MQAARDAFGRDDAVSADILLGHLLHTENRAVAFLVDMDQLGERGNRGIDDLIAKNDSKRLIADQVLSAQYGMSQTQGFRLADITEVGKIRNLPDLMQELAFAGSF